MTTPQEIPAEFWEAARSLRNIVNWQSNASVEPLARYLLARDTAARKECAEIARTCMLTVPLTPGSADGASIAGKQIATAIEASIGGENG